MLKGTGIKFPGMIFLLFLTLALASCAKGPTDESIGQTLKASLFSDPQLKNEPIQIAVANGEVTLSGEVSSDAARLGAYKLANEMPGVKKVIDSLTVKSAQPAQPAQVAQAAVTPPRGPRSAASAAKVPASVEPEPRSSGPKPAQAELPPKAVGTTPGPAAAAPAAPPPKHYTIPAGTDLRIQMIDSINSKTSQVGAVFQASLDSPITVEQDVVVPKGNNVFVRLVNAKSAGKITGQSELELELDHLQFQGKSIPLKSSTYQQVGKSRGKQTAERTAIGTGVGAAIGAIAGGGKGAAIGAAIGAGGGLATQVFIHGKEVQVPSETKLDFKLAEPLEVTVQPGQGSKTGTRTPAQPVQESRPTEEF